MCHRLQVLYEGSDTHTRGVNSSSIPNKDKILQKSYDAMRFCYSDTFVWVDCTVFSMQPGLPIALLEIR